MADKPADSIIDDVSDELKPLEQAEPVNAQSDLLEEAQAKAADYWERLLRVQAELDNVQRRTEREIVNAHKFSLEKFAKELLPIVDSLEMALQSSVTDDLKAIFAGIELTHKMLLDSLQKHGIKQLNPLNKVFNPEQHEAVTTQPNTEVEPNTVIVVMQKGYTLYERLIRPALVVVSTH